MAVVHSWPLASDPAHLGRLDNDDASLNTWAITWVAHILPRHPLQLFDAPIFHPEQHTLAYSEHLVVPSLIGAPLLWLGASPVLVHNLLIIAGLALSGWAMCLVMTRWTGSIHAGLVAGLVYAFNAHVLTRFPHLQAQHVEFFPLVLYAFDRILAERRRRDGMLLALAFLLQALCSNYLLVFTAFGLVAAALVRGDETWRARAPLTLAAAISVAGMAPFLWPYYQVSRDQGLTRSIEEVARYSAGWRDYLVTGGRLHYAAWSHAFFEGRTALFPGMTALALAAFAIVKGQALRDPRARMAMAIIVLGVAFSFGPGLPGYAWLHEHLPLLGGIRNAARWGWLALAGIAVLAGLGAARLRPAVAAVICVLVTVEAIRTPVGYTRFEGLPRIYERVAAEGDVVVAEFPMYSGARIAENGSYVLANSRYLRPLVNGYSGFQPRSFEERATVLTRFPAGEAIEMLRTLGVTHVTVHHAPFVDRYGEAALLVVQQSDALSMVETIDDVSLYRLK